MCPHDNAISPDLHWRLVLVGLFLSKKNGLSVKKSGKIKN
jgi:hypothetical protein